MPYEHIRGGLRSEDSTQGWELGVAIAPSVLDKSNSNNKIQTITEIINSISMIDHNTKISLYVIENGEGTTSGHKLSQDNRGKEIRIKLSDKDFQNKARCYALLLFLWRKLQKAQIPLRYIPTPDYQNIPGPANLTTPFSILRIRETEQTHAQNILPENSSSANTLVLKKDEDHPLAKINLATEDLAAYHIKYKKVEIAKSSILYYETYIKKALKELQITSEQQPALAQEKNFLEKEKQAFEAYRTLMLKARVEGTFTNLKNELKTKLKIPLSDLATKLYSFNTEIAQMNLEPNKPQITQEVIESFKNLSEKIQNEIISHKKCDFDDTCYPIIIEHFTKIAKEINKGKKYNKNEVAKLSQELKDKLAEKPPMGKGLKTAICGVIGAVIGAIVGFCVGGALTFFAGGAGAVPALITGAAAGFFLGTELGMMTGAIGFFSAEKNISKYSEKQRDKQNINSEVSGIILTQ